MTTPLRVAHIATIDLTLRAMLLPQLRYLREQGFDVTGISAPGPWTKDLEAEGIRHIPWHNATRAWNPKADARAFRELAGIFRRERFDIVHTHNPKPGLMGRFAGRLTGVPFVVNTVHGLYATPEDRWRKKVPILGLEWLAARCSDFELYQSEEDLNWARRMGLVRRAKSALLGNGIDLTRFDPSVVPQARLAELRRELGIPADAPVVGTVGRLVAEKGYRELFEAAAAVRREQPEARFLVVGDADPDKPDAITSEELRAAGENVIFVGWREDVRDLLGLMDVFVLPSWREGVPRSAIEAAAMGRALVLTNVRGCREVVRDGIEGLLVPPRDPASLTTALLDVLTDAELRDRFGTAARLRARMRYDEASVTRRVLNSYRPVSGFAFAESEPRDALAG